jgi:hypothetical protein
LINRQGIERPEPEPETACKSMTGFSKVESTMSTSPNVVNWVQKLYFIFLKKQVNNTKMKERGRKKRRRGGTAGSGITITATASSRFALP